jgi:hypothetical protein
LRRIGGTQSLFDIGDVNIRVPYQVLGFENPLFEGCHTVRRFQGILRRNHPPYFVELQQLQRQQADMEMAFMGGVKRPAQNSYPKPRYGMTPADIGEYCQGRT